MNWPEILRNEDEIAAFIASISSEYVDEEFDAEYFRDTHAVLVWLPLSALQEGNPDGNLADSVKEEVYMALPATSTPPLVVEDGKIADGNHRLRVARKRGDEGAWCYEVREGPAPENIPKP